MTHPETEGEQISSGDGGELLVPTLMLVLGAAPADAAGSRPGPGNWLALLVTLPLGYYLARGVVYEVTWSSRGAFRLDTDLHELLGIGYLFAQPGFAVAGWLLAHGALAFAAPAARMLWRLLILR
jgi:hypothetical protein